MMRRGQATRYSSLISQGFSRARSTRKTFSKKRVCWEWAKGVHREQSRDTHVPGMGKTTEIVQGEGIESPNAGRTQTRWRRLSAPTTPSAPGRGVLGEQSGGSRSHQEPAPEGPLRPPTLTPDSSVTLETPGVQSRVFSVTVTLKTLHFNLVHFVMAVSVRNKFHKQHSKNSENLAISQPQN